LTHSEMITNQFGEQYLYAVNRNLFEQEPARERIEREFGPLLAREDSLIIFIGSDSGTVIRYVMDRGVPPGTRFIFVETDELLPQVADAVDLEPFAERVLLVSPEQIEQAIQDADINSYLYVDSVFLRRSLSAEYGFIPRYRSDYWEVESLLNDRRWNTVVSLGQDAFIHCQLQNCADNLHPLVEIKGCLEGKSVMVLGGGPSLDEHLDWIKAHRAQLVLFSVSRISRRLQQVGLEPDFVFSVDPQEISYQFSKEMLEFSPRVIFVNQYHVAPKLLSQWPHRKFYMGMALPWTTGLNPDNNCNGVGPTVTNAAISAAAWLGCRTIYLSGVDLCFTPEGYTHAQGSRERAAGPKTDLSNLSVITNSGKRANTGSDYYSAIRSLSLQAKLLLEQGTSIINISANAARIEGVLYKPVSEITLDGTGFDIDLPDIDQNNDYSRLSTLEQELKHKLEAAEKVSELVRNALDIHDSMYRDGVVDETLKQELESIDDTLAKEHEELFKLIKMLSIRGLIRMAQTFREPDEVGLEEVKEKLDLYYRSLKSGVSRLIRFLETGVESVQVRRREQDLDKKTAAEVDRVVSSWMERQEPGRACFKIFEAVSANESMQKARAAFEHFISTDQLSEFTAEKRRRNLHALPMRIQQLKDNGDLTALEQLKGSLIDTDGGEGYLPLLMATIYQLEKQPEKALQELIPVMEQPESPVLEQVLALMVRLCTELGLHQAALDAMAGLASLNARYLRFYADALAANGQAGDAVEHLTEYLHYFPGDLEAIDKLESWYAAADCKEGVSLAQTLRKSVVEPR